MRMNRRQRIKSEIGTFSAPIPLRSGGVREIETRGWILLKVDRVKVRIRTLLASEHKGKPVTIEEEVDWPAAKEREALRRHVQAVAIKYKRRYMAGEWPEERNYLSHCNSRGVPGFIASNCAGCPARYCTVSR